MNPLRGEAEVAAGGAKYRLAFDVSAFCYMEKALEPMSTDDIVAEVAGGTANITLLRAVVWAALQRHHPDTHLIQAGEIMSDAGLPAILKAVADGLSAAFGLAPEGGEDENPPIAKDGTGSGFSPSGAKRGSSRTPSGNRVPA